MSEEKSLTPKEISQVIEIKNIDVMRIIQGISQIGQLDIEDFTVNLAISKTLANLTSVEKAYEKSIQSLTKKHVKTLENGNFAVENGCYVFISANDKKAYEEAKEKMDNTIVTEKVWTLKTSVLKDVKGVKGTMLGFCHELIVDDANILG